MNRCFVIQPFDNGQFDKRYREVYAPAIQDANLDPYRVDEDFSVDVPIEAIEDGIRASAVCLADITLDNPNVWYELGFAFAVRRQVVMICSDEREGKYPFDIQHRTVNRYKTESPEDFAGLRSLITKRIAASLQNTERLSNIAAADNVAPIDGMSQVELAVLAAAVGNLFLPEHSVWVHLVKGDVEQSGFTSIGFSLGLKKLRDKGLVAIELETDDRGEEYEALKVTSPAWEWIESNEDKFLLRRESSVGKKDDELPF